MRVDEIDNNKKKVLELLEEHHGIVTSACKSMSLARATFYKWCNDDPEFKSSVDEISETAIDFVESKLMENIDSNDVGSIIFYLKTKGKKRGYVEKSEQSITVNVEQPLFGDEEDEES